MNCIQPFLALLFCQQSTNATLATLGSSKFADIDDHSAMNHHDDGKRFAAWASMALGLRMRMELFGGEGFKVYQKDDAGTEHRLYDSHKTPAHVMNTICTFV